MGYGFAGHIGLAKETGWGSGTAVASGDYVEALSEDLSLSIERFQHKAIIGALAEPDDTAALRRIEGTVRFAGHPVAIGHFLNGVLKTVSRTVISSANNLYQYDFFSTAVGADFSTEVPLQPYSIEVFRDVTTSIRYTGCVVNALTLNIEPNAALMCDARMLGRGTSVASKTTPTFPGSPSKPFTFDTASLSIGGSGTALIETLALEINNNLTGFGALNQSTDIAKIRRTDHQMVTLRGTIDFANIDEYLKFVSQTEQVMTLSFTKASSFALDISMPRMVYTAYPLGIPGKDRILTNFEGKAFYSQGSGHAIRVRLTTVKSSY